MGRYSEHYESLRIEDALASCLQTLYESRDYSGLENEPGDIEEHDRLEQVLKFVRARLAAVDPELVTVAQADTISGKLGTVKRELDEYLKDGVTSHLVGANAACDSVVAVVASLPVPISESEVTAINDAAKTLRRSVGQLIKNVTNQRSSINARLKQIQGQGEELGKTIEAQKGRLDTALTQHQGHFSEQENARQSAFNQALQRLENEWRSGLEQARSKSDQQLERQRESLQAVADEWRDERARLRSEVDQEAKSFESDLEERAADLSAQADAVLRDLQVSQDEAMSILQVIANTAIRGFYQRRAVVAQRSTWFWQAITAAAMVLSLCLGYSVFTPLLKADAVVSSAEVVARLALVSLFGAPAVWASRQAVVYRRREYDYRRRDLKLATLEPFLHGMADDKAAEFRNRFAEQFFTGEDTDADEDATSATAPSFTVDELTKLLKPLLDLLRSK